MISPAAVFFAKQHADIATDAVKDELTKVGKVATGATISGIHPRLTVGETSITAEVWGPKSYLYIRDGRRPGSKMPPKGVLDDWMRARGIDLSADFAIRKKIARDGIKGKDILGGAKRARQTDLKTSATRCLYEIVRGMTNKQLVQNQISKA